METKKIGSHGNIPDWSCKALYYPENWAKIGPVDFEITGLTETDKNKYETSLCSAIYKRWQCGTARIRPPHATAVAIDRYLLPTGPTAANLQQWVCCCGPVMGQSEWRTNGRIPYRFADPAPHTNFGLRLARSRSDLDPRPKSVCFLVR